MDSPARTETQCRQAARVREVSATCLIEANARAIVERADRSKTRGCVELSDHKPGDRVDLWFEPKNKDQRGWRGPGAIASINAEDGNFSIRFQGRTLDRRNQEVRPHIDYLVFATLIMPAAFESWRSLR